MTIMNTRPMNLKNYQLKTLIKTGAVTLFCACVLVYIVLKTEAVSKGVHLDVQGIQDGMVVFDGILPISGNAARAKHLLVNGREIFINQAGDFTDTLVLSPGYTIITIQAEDKFGTITQRRFEVIRQISEELNN